MKKTKKGVVAVKARKIVKGLLAIAMLITTVVGSLELTKVLASDEENVLGLVGTTTYSDDKKSAELGLDMSKLDVEKYELVEILGPKDEGLDISNPKVIVNCNGEYQFIINYQEKIEPEVKEETTETDTSSNEVKGDELQGEAKSEVLEGTVEKQVQEVETIKIKYVVDKIVIDEVVNSGKEETTTDDKVQPDVDNEKSLYNGSTRAMSNQKIEDIFDANKATVNGSEPFLTATNINGSIKGNTLVGYNAFAEGQTPNAEYISGLAGWTVRTDIPTKEMVNMDANWTYEGTTGFPSSMNGADSLQNTTSVTFEKGGHSFGVALNRRNLDGGMSISNVFTDGSVTEGKLLGNADFFSTPRKYTVRNIYNPENNTAQMEVNIEGQILKSLALSLDKTGTKANINIRTVVVWGSYQNTIEAKNKFPVVKNSMIFDSFQYDNFNPVFEDLKWYDKDGNEVIDESNVNSGDELTVKATVKNDSEIADNISAKLFLSDDSTQALTKGVSPDSNLQNGIPVNLTNTPQEVTFKVIVDDTIGKISLGLRLEDDFFHVKKYKQVSSNISIGEIFPNGSPSYTIMDLARDGNGDIVQDASGNPTFIQSNNQNDVNQDSYVKVNVTMKNPRLNETLRTVVKLDTSLAPGLDFTDVSNLVGLSGKFDTLLTGYALDLTPGGEANFSFIVPVKQTSAGTPFNMGEQKLKFEVAASFILNGATESGTWLKDSVVTSKIIDIDMVLTTTKITLRREELFNILDDTKLSFIGVNVAPDSSSMSVENQGTLAEWQLFGLDAANDSMGTVVQAVEDGTTMSTKVTYNKTVLLNGKKHYTRMGSGKAPGARTKTALVTLEVNGGTVYPAAYFDVPKAVTLYDEGGIDTDHAGAKVEIGIKETLNTSMVFDVKADNNFLISDTKGKSYAVTLHDKDTNPYGLIDGNKANLGSFDSTNKKKVVWYNIVKDVSRATSNYKGAMMFYISNR